MAKKDLKKELLVRIEKAGIDNIDQIVTDIEKLEGVSADEKETLLSTAHEKRNELEIEHDKSQEKVDEANDAAAEDAKFKSESTAKKPKTIPGTKTVQYKSEEELQGYQRDGILVGVTPTAVGKGIAIIKASIVAFLITVLAAPAAMADFGDRATLGARNSDGNYDCRVKSGIVSADDDGDFQCAKEMIFRSYLLADGRYGTSILSLASSSTVIGVASVPYAYILKNIGGGGGLDVAGSVLPNGIPGQVLTILITGLQSGGTWKVTPTTKTGFTSVTFDTKGDSATFKYLDDTTGWLLDGAFGVTVTQA